MIRVGPAGWSYKDWNGIVYPTPKPKNFSEPGFLADYFDTLEINVSFYRPLTRLMVERWAKAVKRNPRFRFTAKLWRGYTHERSVSEAEQAEVQEGLDALHDSGLFGALLLQFPHSFKNDPEAQRYLAELRARFHELPLVLEVRHRSWAEPGVLDFLERMEIGLCNIDQPVFRSSLKPSAIATSTVGYIRLHGRRYDTWFGENKFPGARYDYKYSPDELQPWADRVKQVAQSASDTYVVTNNHYLGKAAVNGLEISSILTGKPVRAPETLVSAYPELAAYTLSEAPKQLDLL